MLFFLQIIFKKSTVFKSLVSGIRLLHFFVLSLPVFVYFMKFGFIFRYLGNGLLKRMF